MDDYVDVAERIRNFAERFPEGSLQSELTQLEGGWLCKAFAYRSMDDTRPGIGHAFEPVPGKTPYTKDSEAMNAETSAWGRAIVALGFETKKIASAQEVRARENTEPKPAANGVISPPQRKRLWAIAKEHAVPDDVIKSIVLEVAGVESTQDITKDRYDAVIGVIEAHSVPF